MAPHVEDGNISVPVPSYSKTMANFHDENAVPNGLNGTSQKASLKAPLQLTGALDQFKSFDVTPVIGKEFQDVDLSAWLRAPNSDELLRDLAITSQCIYHEISDKKMYS